jgi:glycosyl-4,4'-diaponeurosporenoate acyltransferase
MLIELSIGGVIALNIFAWLVIQFSLAWSFTQFSAERFNPRSLLARPCFWERSGRFYERWLLIKLWKDKLPDAASWFRGGFAKAQLQARSPESLARLARETWRGEIVHWLALLCVLLFCVWNPLWAVLVNAAYAIAANLPCILAQRYNRARLLQLLDKRSLAAAYFESDSPPGK